MSEKLVVFIVVHVSPPIVPDGCADAPRQLSFESNRPWLYIFFIPYSSSRNKRYSLLIFAIGNSHYLSG